MYSKTQIWFISGLVLFAALIVWSLWTSAERRARRTALVKTCATAEPVHVLLEAQLGGAAAAAHTAALVFDNAACPTRVQLHILEHVTSIKAFDDLTPALQKSALVQPRFGHWFHDQTHVHKVHRSRELLGPKAIRHLLDSTTLNPSDLVIWMPVHSNPAIGWDDAVRAALGDAPDVTVLVAPSAAGAAAPRLDGDALGAVEAWLGGAAAAGATPAFFAVDSSLLFKALPMSRPGVAPALGLSAAWPWAARAALAGRMAAAWVAAGLETEDLAMSLLAHRAGAVCVHPGAPIATPERAPRRVPNRRHQIAKLLDVLDASSSAWLSDLALAQEDDDVVVYARALLGMTAKSTQAEVLVKWGSEAALATEREALQWG